MAGEDTSSRCRTFDDGAVVQLVAGRAGAGGAVAEPIQRAAVLVDDHTVTAVDGATEWSWLIEEIEALHHSPDAPWTILVVPGIAEFGVQVAGEDVSTFRAVLDDRWRALHPDAGYPVVERAPDLGPTPSAPPVQVEPLVAVTVTEDGATTSLFDPVAPTPGPYFADPVAPPLPGSYFADPVAAPPSVAFADPVTGPVTAVGALSSLEARSISAWFGAHHVLDRVSLTMPAGQVTALIGPSGCGKSTFLRILNRMHELIPSAALAGEVLLGGDDVYDPQRKITEARRQIGMVFQKPNPFPAMSIYDNVIASLKLTGTKASTSVKDELVESCLQKAGLWNEVRDRLRQPGGGLSGGQQQRLCIARALAIKPRILLMDEPCSALDPTSTRRIEETITELVTEVTIVIVTHNMQQAQRVSHQCAFFLAAQGTPGVIVEHGPTDAMFSTPQDQRTSDYVHGRFG